MADSNTDSDVQVTFNVKSSSDSKYALTLPATTTVAELKQKLSSADYADTPADRQRLIYSGRVLKDADTLASYKIKDGNTVHLVKSAASNARQAPANQGGAASVPPGAGQAASNVPTNIAAGTGAGDPLAQITGARYAGFHGLPGAEMFGADGGMGAPQSPDQMLRMLEDPNFAQQMNEAMNNPAIVNMLRNNPMIRDNPMARAAIENPELRRLMFNPDMIRMQMQMQRAMGRDGAGGEGSFPMPGQTDTTERGANADAGANEGAQTGQTAQPGQPGSAPANPFAALFPPGAAGGATPSDNPPNPFAGLGGQAGSDPLAQMTRQLMQNPEAMQQMMQAFGGGGAGGAGGAGEAGFNPFGGLGGFGNFGGASQEPPAPADTRPPEERYENQLRSLNDMGFYDFERNVAALRRSGGSVQGAVEYLLSQ
ncbi:Deubiquitination-protection protein dph1 [Cercospora zeina]